MLTLCQNDKGACVLDRRSILTGSAHRNGHEHKSMERFGPPRTGVVDSGNKPPQPPSESTSQACEVKEVIEWQ